MRRSLLHLISLGVLLQLSAATAGFSNDSPAPAPVYCAWLAWTGCEDCQQQATRRTRACHCEYVEFAAPLESHQCDSGDQQSDDCSDANSNGSCFYTWPSTSIVMLGLGLLLLTAVLLAFARIRQYYGRILFCRTSDGRASTRRGAGADGGVGSRRRVVGVDPDGPGAFDFPPPFHVAVADWPPAYSECAPQAVPPRPLPSTSSGAVATTMDDFPPPYEESVARFKREIRFSTQRWAPGTSSQSDCAPGYAANQSDFGEGGSAASQSNCARVSTASQSDFEEGRNSANQSDSEEGGAAASQSNCARVNTACQSDFEEEIIASSQPDFDEGGNGASLPNFEEEGNAASQSAPIDAADGSQTVRSESPIGIANAAFSQEV